MNKIKILQKVLSDRRYIQVCRSISHYSDLWQDLYQEMLLLVMEYKESKLVYLYESDELFRYLTGVLKLMWTSKKSPFYLKYRHKEKRSEGELELLAANAEYDHETDRIISGIEKELASLYWFDRRLFESYMLEGSCQKLSEKTSIPYRTVANKVKEVKERIRQKISIDV